MYRLADEDLYLNPTAEVPVTNIYREEIVDGAALPIRLVGYCASYRRGPAPYGRETRGMVRVHQFDKVEPVKIVRPRPATRSTSRSSRTPRTCCRRSARLSRRAARGRRPLLRGRQGYDLETWALGEGRWLEVSSCSNFEEFQARRAGIRFRNEATGKAELAHTLNASGLALPRTFATSSRPARRSAGRSFFPSRSSPTWAGVRELTPG